MSAQNWTDILKQLIDKRSLTAEQAAALMQGWLDGAIAPELSGAILIALQWKGVDAVELAAIAGVLQGSAVTVDRTLMDGIASEQLLDTCGTGGDGAETFNISTSVAFVAAAAGVPVAKHGSRAVSSRSGSADVLECLGINLAAPSEKIHAAIAAVGITFLFAPSWHPAMKAVAPIRRTLGVRTVFNLIGPLVNPLNPGAQVLGVYDRTLTPIVSEALRLLGRQRAVVLHSREGLDEAGLGDITDISFLQNGAIAAEEISPQDLGLARAPIGTLKGGNVEANAEILRSVLQGKGTRPQMDCVALNAGLALRVAGVAHDWSEGVRKAAAIVESGVAWQKVEQLVKFLA
jgi:anthranilate phosphoribosyltransferase